MDVVSYILAKQYTNEKIAEVDPGASGEQALQEIAEAKQDALSSISTEEESSVQEVKNAAQQEATSQIANIQSAAQSAAQEAANDIATEKQNAITDLQEEAKKQNSSLAGTAAQALEVINLAANNKVAEINEVNSHSPIINEETGKWQLWDEDSKSYVDTDIDAEGQPGQDGEKGEPGTPAGFGTPTATATTLPYGEEATVTVTSDGPDTAKVFNFEFGIPQGAPGSGGGGGTVSVTVGETTTGEPGTEASVVNSGDDQNVVLEFTIPRGAAGQDGASGADGQDGAPGQAATITVGSVSTGEPGTNASVTNSGTENAAVFDFVIPRGTDGTPGQNGQDGADGAAATISVGEVITGEPGTDAEVVNTGNENAAVLKFTIPRGATGQDGQKGDPGVGVPSGGTAGQVLVKKTETDYDTEWKDIEGGTSSPINIYTGTALDEQTDSDVLQQIAPSPSHGDIAVITRAIHGEINSANSYIYNTDDDASVWQPLNEKYGAEDVYFSSNITITANIGVQTIDSTGSKTLETAGKNLKQVFDMIVAEEKNPTITQPSVTARLNNSGAKEVGTNVTPSYTCTLNPGNYQYSPATGIVATSWSVSDTNSNNAETASGTFSEIQVTEGTNYKITAIATYGDGAIPVTNLSNDYAAGQIKAGSKTGTSAAITGYRNSFYGTLEDKATLPDSATIRTLTKSNKALGNGSKFSINIPVGAIRVVISYPATLRDLTSVTDVNGMGAEISPSFVLNTIQVAGENNYNPVDYKTYILDYANPNDTQNTYNVTI